MGFNKDDTRNVARRRNTSQRLSLDAPAAQARDRIWNSNRRWVDGCKPLTWLHIQWHNNWQRWIPQIHRSKSVFLCVPNRSFFSPLPVTWQVDMTAAPMLFQQTSFSPEWRQLMVNFLILPRSTLNNTTLATPEPVAELFAGNFTINWVRRKCEG